MRLISLLILALFYIVYIGKMILQRRKGIQTDQMAKDKKKTRVFYNKLIMKIATYSVVAVEILSIHLTLVDIHLWYIERCRRNFLQYRY